MGFRDTPKFSTEIVWILQLWLFDPIGVPGPPGLPAEHEGDPIGEGVAWVRGGEAGQFGRLAEPATHHPLS